MNSFKGLSKRKLKDLNHNRTDSKRKIKKSNQSAFLKKNKNVSKNKNAPNFWSRNKGKSYRKVGSSRNSWPKGRLKSKDKRSSCRKQRSSFQSPGSKSLNGPNSKKIRMRLRRRMFQETQ